MKLHRRTDPACVRYKAARPGSRKDARSRGRWCPVCSVPYTGPCLMCGRDDDNRACCSECIAVLEAED